MTPPKLPRGVLDLIDVSTALTQILWNVAVEVGLRKKGLRVLQDVRCESQPLSDYRPTGSGARPRLPHLAYDEETPRYGTRKRIDMTIGM